MLKGEDISKVGLWQDSALSIYLDLFRWTAAFCVVLTHANYIFFVKVTSLAGAERGMLHMAIAFVSGWGRPAVIIFFVLSGFLVGGGALRRYQATRQFDAVDYMVARFSRLWLVLLPALLLTGAIVYISIEMLGVGLSLDSITVPSSTTNAATLRPSIFLCNAVFLHVALCPSFAGNAALWTLYNEFWYYVAWMPLMIALFSRRSAIIRIGLALGAVALLGTLSALQADYLATWRDCLIVYFLFWLIGVAAAMATRPLFRMPLIFSVALCLGALLTWRLALPPGLTAGNLWTECLSDLLVALPFANLVVAMRFAPLVMPPLPRFHQQAAAFSFSLYVLHEPLLLTVAAWTKMRAAVPLKIVPRHIWDLGPPLAGIILCVLIAWIFGQLIERRTLAVRRGVMGWLGQRHIPARQRTSAG